MVGIAIKAILVITILIDSGLFLFIFLRRQHGVLYKLMLLYLLGIFGWSMSTLLVLQYEEILFAQFAFATALVLAVSKFFFILVFPENKLPAVSPHYWIVILAFTAFILSFVEGAYFTTVSVVNNYYVVIENGVFAPLYSFLIAYLLIYPIYILAKKYRSKTYGHIVQQQLKYLLYGTSLFFIVGLTTNSILPVFFGIYLFNGLGPSFSLILAGFIIYIITKHQFLDIRIVIQRGLIYTALLAGIVSFYIVTINFIGVFSNQITSITALFGAILTTIVGIFSVPHIDRYLRKKTDKYFFKDTYNYSDALYTLSEVINRDVVLKDIVKLTEDALQRLLKTNDVSVHIANKNRKSKIGSGVEVVNNETSLTVPIVLENRSIGSIHLGAKLSGDPYTQEDISLLRTFSHQAATAFEKARLYKEVEDYSLQLEKRVEERTEQIHALQENQKQMMLEISHKLQNPLAVVKTELGFLRKQLPEDKTLSAFEKTIDDIAIFVSDLLRLAWFDAQEERLDVTRINMSQLLTELIEYYETIAQAQHITLEHAIVPGVYVHGDRARLEELITNLVSNAVKYIGNGSKNKARKITIGLAVTKKYAILSVEDTGTGIKKEELPNIFSRFYRMKDVQHASVTGTGLGLAICQKIAEMHEGTITAISTYDKGTKFTVTLPRLFT